MSIPSLAGTWWTQANVPCNDSSTVANLANSVIHNFVKTLQGAITTSGTFGSTNNTTRPASTYWTVVGSGDGTTGSLDGVDRTTGSVPNSFDTTKWVHAASGTAHTWIVLKSPDALGPLYMCVDLNSATTTTIGIITSRNAFVQSTLGFQPMTASRPISNNTWAVGNSAEPVQTTNIAFMNDVATAQLGLTFRTHLSVDSSGASHFMLSRDGTGIFSTYLSLFQTIDRNPNDNLYSYFNMFHNVTSGRGAPSWATVGITVANCNGRTVDGGLIHSAGGFSSWCFGASSTNWASSATPDQGYAYARVLPIYIQTLVTGRHCWRGRVPDTWLVGAIDPGAVFPTGSIQQCVVGDIIIPYAGSYPIL